MIFFIFTLLFLSIYTFLCLADQIAVADFAAGAMENWGLVIYRETALLFDPAINSASNQQRVAVVVTHELAHQVILNNWSVAPTKSCRTTKQALQLQ